MREVTAPANEAVPDVWTAVAFFFMATGFFVVGTLLLFVTRRMLAAYWLYFFSLIMFDMSRALKMKPLEATAVSVWPVSVWPCVF